MLKVILEPLDGLAIEADIGVNMIILIDVDGANLEIVWKRADIYVCHIIEVAQEHAFDDNRLAAWLLSIIEANTEFLDAQMASLTTVLSDLEAGKFTVLTIEFSDWLDSAHS